MKLHNLEKVTTRKRKRVGRGYSSGKGGHTTFRGQKGQRSRSKLAMWFEGGQLPFIRRFPFQRGKGRFKSLSNEVVTVNLGMLNKLPSKVKEVDVGSLVENGLVSKSEASKKTIKVLGDGKLERALNIKLITTKRAAEKIKAAGGSVS
jgi:large subunit ribosomal protein L15